MDVRDHLHRGGDVVHDRIHQQLSHARQDFDEQGTSFLVLQPPLQLRHVLVVEEVQGRVGEQNGGRSFERALVFLAELDLERLEVAFAQPLLGRRVPLLVGERLDEQVPDVDEALLPEAGDQIEVVVRPLLGRQPYLVQEPAELRRGQSIVEDELPQSLAKQDIGQRLRARRLLVDDLPARVQRGFVDVELDRALLGEERGEPARRGRLHLHALRMGGAIEPPHLEHAHELLDELGRGDDRRLWVRHAHASTAAPSSAAIASTSLSPRPDRQAITRLPGATSGGRWSSAAIAWALSTAGMIPSNSLKR